MGRYMTELGMTPASRSRVAPDPRMQLPTISFTTIYEEQATQPRRRPPRSTHGEAMEPPP